MYQQDLGGQWDITLGRKNLSLKGSVPGDIHDALLQAGIIPDPHYDVQAKESYFISSEPITYKRTFTPQWNYESVRLVLEGIDGTADIYLNGELLTTVKNAFRRYWIPVTNLLKPGENEIAIRFTPVESLLGKRLDELGGWKLKRVYLRKPQYNFGWDWALPLPGVGVFGYVKLEYDFTWELIDYSVSTDLSGRIDFSFEVSPPAYEDGYTIQVQVFGHGENERFTVSRASHRSYGHVVLKKPKLWWPNGYGEQPLYQYVIQLICKGKVCHEITGRVGIRKIELLEEPFTPDAGDGYSFWLKVNGKRVFLKGGNWIPMELWPGKIDPADYDFQLKMTKFANFNVQRVWGGGIYEHPRFYELCDELGILVWQDFMFASAGYPATIMRDEIVREATYQLKRLRNHTCIGLWCGCNEDFNSWIYTCNDSDARDFYEQISTVSRIHKDVLSQRDSGFYTDEDSSYTINRTIEEPLLFSMILRGLTGKLGLGVPYIESSPMARDDAGNAPSSGNCHISAWKYALFSTNGQFENWREHFDKVCAFDSEFCDQGPCSVKLFKSFMKEENHWPPNGAWVYHIQKGHRNLPHYEQTLMIAGATFGEIDSLQTYTKYGQTTHLEMMRSEFESARFDYPNNGGTMMWMFNDCWPTSNWSIIDYTHNPKPCFYAAKSACAEYLPIIFERKGTIYFAFSNHSLNSAEVKATFGQRRFDGSDVTKETATVCFHEGETVRFGQIRKDALSDACDYLYLEVETGENRYASKVYFPFGWKNLQLPAPQYTAKVTAIEACADGYRADITVTADSFVRLFHAYGEGNRNPVFTDNYFDLEKGETRSISGYFKEKPDISHILFGDFTTDWE